LFNKTNQVNKINQMNQSRLSSLSRLQLTNDEECHSSGSAIAAEVFMNNAGQGFIPERMVIAR